MNKTLVRGIESKGVDIAQRRHIAPKVYNARRRRQGSVRILFVRKVFGPKTRFRELTRSTNRGKLHIVMNTKNLNLADKAPRLDSGVSATTPPPTTDDRIFERCFFSTQIRGLVATAGFPNRSQEKPTVKNCTRPRKASRVYEGTVCART